MTKLESEVIRLSNLVVEQERRITEHDRQIREILAKINKVDVVSRAELPPPHYLSTSALGKTLREL